MYYVTAEVSQNFHYTRKFYEIIFEINLTRATSFLPLICSGCALDCEDGATPPAEIDSEYSCEMER